MNKQELEKKLAAIETVEPDITDLRMLAAAKAENDDELFALDAVKDELEGYSGKMLIRIPRSLHRRLAVEAKREGVSLNQYAMYKLSR